MQTSTTESKPTQLPQAVETLVSEIYKARYKEGPIIREFYFGATSLEAAKERAKVYVDHLQLKVDHNRTIILVGQVEPFCVNIDSLLAEKTLTGKKEN